MASSVLHITCPRGIAPFLKREAEALEYTVEQSVETGIFLRGTIRDAIRLNYLLHTAHRVLMLIREFRANDPDKLYQHIHQLPWENWIRDDVLLSVTTSGSSPAVRDPRFAALRVKDAIVDRIRDKTGTRPNAGPERTGAVIHLHWDRNRVASLYFDTSGVPLSHRGYRTRPGKAPMRETLAAACLMAAEWPERPLLIHPMCGSGTLAIEAAMIAASRAPGFLRKTFGFRAMKHVDPELEESVRTDLTQTTPKASSCRIIANDHDPDLVKAAVNNATAAGVADHIEFSVCDLRQCPVPAGPGIVMLNPPYGERLGQDQQLSALYRTIGQFLKNSCCGKSGYVLTGNLPLARAIGLRSDKKTFFMNGPIECRLFEYELYEKPRRDDHNKPDH